MEFSSYRKRMAILVQDKQDDIYKLYIKGADNVILDRLCSKARADYRHIHETERFLKKSSMQGYRTLLLAMKVLEQDEVDDFLNECKEAE